MFVDLLYLFFPNYCLNCQVGLYKGEQFICTACFNAIPLTNYHAMSNNAMIQKFYGRVPIRYAMALGKFRKGSSLRILVHQMKYVNQPKIGHWLGSYYGDILAAAIWESPFQVIIPVPLHETKLRQRGYNQSDYFAQGLSNKLGIPWQKHCLQRMQYTTPQTIKNKLDRLRNLVYAFCIVDKKLIQGKHVLLVDDVITTGATLEACVNRLLEADAQQVSIATIGITD